MSSEIWPIERLQQFNNFTVSGKEYRVALQIEGKLARIRLIYDENQPDNGYHHYMIDFDLNNPAKILSTSCTPMTSTKGTWSNAPELHFPYGTQLELAQVISANHPLLNAIKALGYTEPVEGGWLARLVPKAELERMLAEAQAAETAETQASDMDAGGNSEYGIDVLGGVANPDNLDITE